MSQQESCVVDVNPTPEDYEFLQREVSRPVKATLLYRVLSWAQLAFLATVLVVASEFLVDRGHLPVWVAAIISIYPAMLVSSAISVATRPILMRVHLDPKGLFLTGYEARVDADGLLLKRNWGESRYFWKTILNVKETTTHIFVFVDRAIAVVIPKVGFGSPADADRCVRRLEARGGLLPVR